MKIKARKMSTLSMPSKKGLTIKNLKSSAKYLAKNSSSKYS